MDIMENVYDIRRENNLYYILPNNNVRKINQSVGIIIYLYYYDLLEYYDSYIKKIPENIDVCLVSSEKKVLDFLRESYSNKNWDFRLKENTGRDVSALIITCKDFVFQHEYICFLHDKKPQVAYTQKDTDLWNENMWSNCIEDEMYIESVIDLVSRPSFKNRL